MKLFLRVDGNEEDTLIQNLIQASEAYLEDAIDDFQTKYNEKGELWRAKADLARKLLIADWFENRLPTTTPPQASVSLLIVQLQL